MKNIWNLGGKYLSLIILFVDNWCKSYKFFRYKFKIFIIYSDGNFFELLFNSEIIIGWKYVFLL